MITYLIVCFIMAIIAGMAIRTVEKQNPVLAKEIFRSSLFMLLGILLFGGIMALVTVLA